MSFLYECVRVRLFKCEKILERESDHLGLSWIHREEELEDLRERKSPESDSRPDCLGTRIYLASSSYSDIVLRNQARLIIESGTDKIESYMYRGDHMSLREVFSNTLRITPRAVLKHTLRALLKHMMKPNGIHDKKTHRDHSMYKNANAYQELHTRNIAGEWVKIFE
ncbi:hypothetical protein Fmac_010977 [Flemingia macrophylla]|uniref:Uncharacterized protein n=1 Tax=Flemingia macrophylla TaxID=520843 RepID=A0ABD1ML44_9FABA